ncbi:PKD domain-containing protein [Catellatospora coxensis]
MSGPVYDYDPANPRISKFPEYFEGKWIVYELTRQWWKTLSLHKTAQTFTDPRFGPTTVGGLQSINGIFAGMSWIQPFEAEFGPDGSLYVIDFGAGSGSGRGGSNDGAGIYRIDYVANGVPPTAKITTNRDNGPAPLAVTFSSAGSVGATSYAWDFDGNGTVDSTAANPSYTYTTRGRFNARLTVTGAAGLTAVASTEITVGNTRPTVTINVPQGGFFEFGDRIPYTVTVTDPEDTTIDCNRVVVQTLLGHDSHAHPLDNYIGCSGTLVTESGGGDGHGPGTNLFTLISAQYTDAGATGVPALVGSLQVELQTRSMEAEHFDASSGVSVLDRATAQAGRRLGDIDNGDWINIGPVNLQNISGVVVGASSGGTGGTIEFRNGSPTGALLGTATIPVTGSYDSVVSPTVPLTNPGGTFTLYLKFVKSGQTGDPDIMALDWLRFNGRGVKVETGATLTVGATPTTGTGPLTVNFTSTSTAPPGRTIVDREWRFGDNTATVHAATASHVYSRKGTYTAWLTLTDSAGATHSGSVVITVN